jgi:hypothetical protein
MRRFFRPSFRRPFPDFLTPKTYSILQNVTERIPTHASGVTSLRLSLERISDASNANKHRLMAAFSGLPKRQFIRLEL